MEVAIRGLLVSFDINTFHVRGDQCDGGSLGGRELGETEVSDLFHDSFKNVRQVYLGQLDPILRRGDDSKRGYVVAAQLTY